MRLTGLASVSVTLSFAVAGFEPVERQLVLRQQSTELDVELRISGIGTSIVVSAVFATEAAFRTVLLLFNLLAEFQRASGLNGYREPATIRTQVLIWGAILAGPGAAS